MTNAEIEGQNISKRREWAGLTQAELAERLGVSQSFISQVESGERPWPMERSEHMVLVFEEARRQREADQARMQVAVEAVRGGEG